MRKKNVIIVGCLVLATSLFFQNCAKVSFSALENLSSTNSISGINGPSTPEAKIIDLPIQKITDYPETQVVLVVDNSATMKQSQQALSEKIDKLIENLSQKKVTLRIVTTSDYINSSQIYGTLVDGKENYVGSKTALNGVTENVIYKMKYGPVEKAPYIINPEDPAAIRQKTIENIKTAIANTGTNGSDNESGLCSIIQLASTKTFQVQANEKVIFFLLTDEDNLKSRNHCVDEGVYKVGATSSCRYQYTYVYASIQYKATGSKVADGVITPNQEFPREGETLNVVNSANDKMNGQACKIDDLEAATKKVSGYIGIQRNGKIFSSVEVTKCTYVVSTQGYPVNVTGNSVDYCTSPYYYASTKTQFPNIMAFFEATNPGLVPNQACKKTCTQQDLEMRRTYHLNSYDVAQSFVTELNESSIKGKYKMAIVTNIPGQSCALKSGQSEGSTFIKAASLNPENIKTYSICEGDNGFTRAFEDVTKSSSYVKNDFEVELAEGDYISKVFVLTHGDPKLAQEVSAENYSYQANRLTFNKVLFSEQDEVRVILSKKKK